MAPSQLTEVGVRRGPRGRLRARGGTGHAVQPARAVTSTPTSCATSSRRSPPTRTRGRTTSGSTTEERVYASLHRDAHVDVWLLCWTPENDTGWHDHDISSGAVAVVAGELVENNLTVATGGVETRIGAGKAYSFGPEHIHRLNGAEPGSVSVHAYSPPLWRMGQYAVSDAGVLRRVSVSYADELRPLD